jgi:ESCRT-II complex subunit VPS22
LWKLLKSWQDAIRSDANFRQKFIEMCASIGVDPMSSNKTFSAKLGFGSFYTELGVQVLDVCMRTRSSNGGLIGLQDLTKRVISLRGANSGGIETEDIVRAVRSLQVNNVLSAPQPAQVFCLL